MSDKAQTESKAQQSSIVPHFTLGPQHSSHKQKLGMARILGFYYWIGSVSKLTLLAED